MQQAARVRPPGRFERPAGLHDETLCALSYRQPVDGCPLYTEYFKDGDEVPGGSARCIAAPSVSAWRAPSRAGPPKSAAASATSSGDALR